MQEFTRGAPRACARGGEPAFTCRARRRRPAGRSSGVTGGRSRSAKRHAPAPRVGSHTARREADSVSIRLSAERLSRRDSGSTDRLRARQPRSKNASPSATSRKVSSRHKRGRVSVRVDPACPDAAPVDPFAERVRVSESTAPTNATAAPAVRWPRWPLAASRRTAQCFPSGRQSCREDFRGSPRGRWRTRRSPLTLRSSRRRPDPRAPLEHDPDADDAAGGDRGHQGHARSPSGGAPARGPCPAAARGDADSRSRKRASQDPELRLLRQRVRFPLARRAVLGRHGRPSLDASSVWSRRVGCSPVPRATSLATGTAYASLNALARKFADVFDQAAWAAGGSRPWARRSRWARVNFHSNGVAICS